MDDMTEELIDRFGDLPKKVQQLLHIAALKSLAHSAYITAIEQKGKDYKFILASAEHFPLSLFHFSLSFDKGNTGLLLL